MYKNRLLVSLACLVILVVMPACRKKSKEEKRQERKNISTMIEVDGGVEEKKKEVEIKEIEINKKSVAKF